MNRQQEERNRAGADRPGAVRKLIERIRDGIEDFLRRICGKISPDMRVYIIVSLLVLFAVGNSIFVFSAIYNIGRDRDKRDAIELTPIGVPDFQLEQSQPDSLVGGFEAFFEQHFNTEENDTTDEQEETEP